MASAGLVEPTYMKLNPAFSNVRLSTIGSSFTCSSKLFKRRRFFLRVICRSMVCSSTVFFSCMLYCRLHELSQNFFRDFPLNRSSHCKCFSFNFLSLLSFRSFSRLKYSLATLRPFAFLLKKR